MLLDIPEDLIDSMGIAPDHPLAHEVKEKDSPQADRLIEHLLEQNKKLALLLEQLSGKAV